MKIYEILKKAKLVGWMDEISIRAGAPWLPAIDEALWTAEFVLVIMTPNARNSDYVTYEWSFALGAKKRVVPLLVKRTTPLHRAWHRSTTWTSQRIGSRGLG